MNLLATIVGLLAVALFVFSYQLKRRRPLIFCNAASRLLYVIQYLLLGAFDGAILDSAAFFISLLCGEREKGLVKKHFWLLFTLSNAVILGLGVLTYKNVISLFAILGVFFELLALWLKKEKNIRILSIIAAPCWLVYNLLSGAYGSAVGNVITIVSILVAILRHDIKKRSARNG